VGCMTWREGIVSRVRLVLDEGARHVVHLVTVTSRGPQETELTARIVGRMAYSAKKDSSPALNGKKTGKVFRMVKHRGFFRGEALSLSVARERRHFLPAGN